MKIDLIPLILIIIIPILLPLVLLLFSTPIIGKIVTFTDKQKWSKITRPSEQKWLRERIILSWFLIPVILLNYAILELIFLIPVLILRSYKIPNKPDSIRSTFSPYKVNMLGKNIITLIFAISLTRKLVYDDDVWNIILLLSVIMIIGYLIYKDTETLKNLTVLDDEYLSIENS
jgi:hypothetical protein